MRELNTKIKKLIENTKGDKEIIKSIETENALYPFSVISNLLTYFLSIGELSYNEFTSLSTSYSERNKYLKLYDMAPKTYGNWCERHIRLLFPEFIKANKRNLSKEFPAFSGEFDLWLKGIRVEVKANRANDEKGEDSLSSRAYLHSEAKKVHFEYHFQQLKTSCCDVFIWIGTCRDELLYWVLTSQEVIATKKMSPQHRNENTGKDNQEIFEGQIFMSEEELAPYRVAQKDILNVVLQKGGKL